MLKLPDKISSISCLKQEKIRRLLFSFSLECAISKIQKYKEELNLEMSVPGLP